MAVISVITKNYYPDHTYENQIIQIEIPEELVPAIREHWNKLNGHQFKAMHLYRNQCVDVGMWTDDKRNPGYYDTASAGRCDIDVDFGTLRTNVVKRVKAKEENQLEYYIDK